MSALRESLALARDQVTKLTEEHSKASGSLQEV
jgi:hypothetical protein